MTDIQLAEDTVLDSTMLKERGLRQHHINRLLRQGRLHRVERGIYTTSPPTGPLLLRALAHRRPTLVYTGKTAFEIHSGRDITVPLTARALRGSSATGNPRLSIRHSRKLQSLEMKGVRVVTPIAAVAEHLDHEEADLINFLEQMYQRRAGKELLERHLELLSQVPPELPRLISRAAIGADSEAERQVFRALRERGVRVVQNHNIGGYFFDGVIPGARLVVEIDGYRYHSAENRGTFVLDRWKANYATRHGYRVLRYSGSCVKHHLEQVVEQINAAADDLEEALFTETHPVWKWHETLNRDGPWIPEVAQ